MAHSRLPSGRKSTKKVRATAHRALPSSLSLLVLACLSISGAVVATQSASTLGSSSGSSSGWARGFEGARESFLETVLEANISNQKSCKPQGLIQDACCDYQSVEDVNQDMAERLEDVIKLPFFRYQKVDLFRECPFWQEDGSCMNRACAVEETEEESIPEAYRSGTLGLVKEASEYPKTLEGALFRDEDFCVCDEASPNSEGVYVDLYENPERFTGYAGPSANNVWKAIYEENCFDVVPFMTPSRASEDGGSGYVKSSLLQDASKSVRSLMGSLGLAAPRDPPDDEQCLEKRVYYRLISGLHASISIHICSDYLDQNTGEWKPNLECFITRIGEHPERLQNVYFDYVLMLRALRKATPYLRAYNYDTGDADVDAKTHKAVNALLDKADSCQATFDETSMFSGPGADTLREEFKAHFRNVSRIMDCVGCDKCRLWGKTQVTGVATGLKLLFSFDENATPATSANNSKFSLRRSEIVAFIWTLNRFSESLAAVEQFRQMWAKRNFAPPSKEPETIAEEQKALEQENETAGPTSDALGPIAVPPPQEEVEIESQSSQEEEISSAAFSKSARPSSKENVRSNASSPNPEMSTSIGPLFHNFLERLFDACRSSIVACFALVERGLSFIAGTFGNEKTEL